MWMSRSREKGEIYLPLLRKPQFPLPSHLLGLHHRPPPKLITQPGTQAAIFGLDQWFSNLSAQGIPQELTKHKDDTEILWPRGLGGLRMRISSAFTGGADAVTWDHPRRTTGFQHLLSQTAPPRTPRGLFCTCWAGGTETGSPWPAVMEHLLWVPGPPPIINASLPFHNFRPSRDYYCPILQITKLT